MRGKVVAALLAILVMSLALTACGSSTTETVTGENDSQSEIENEVVSDTQQSGVTEGKLESSDVEIAEEQVDLEGHTLMIYCGAGMTKPFQEIADTFETQTGCEMYVTYANAGQIQSQITTSEEGDFFIAGSGDEVEPVADYVSEQKDLVKHIPVLAVQENNPKEITGLGDLTKDEITLIIGDTEATPVGKIAKKALAELGIFDSVTIEATTTTAPQMATAIVAGEVDAVIVWKENCNADGVEIVDTTDLDNYVKTIPAVVLNCSEEKEAVDAFNAYLDSASAQEIWTNYGYEIVK